MKITILFTVATVALSGCASGSDSNQIGAAPAAVSSQTQAVARTGAPAGPPVLLAGQPSFGSPEEAVQALYSASMAKDLKDISRIVGLPEQDLLTTDASKNTQLAEFFAKEYDEFHKIVPDGDTRTRVFVGRDNYPIASPLVKQDGRWFFDSAGGKEELLARFIGENELATIGVCRAYVQAQYEYYSEDRSGDDVLEYAQQLGSTRGKHDGLYWHTADNEPESPLGPLVAQARSTGFLHGSVHRLDEPKPYHGYLFQILTRQGEKAPGGKHDYIINGHMVAGFALVAYPAKYNTTGVMTFLVGANGKVYEKTLGEQTAEIAGKMDEYNPDGTWTLVQE